MFRNLTYKQKLKYLGYAAIPALFLAYQLSIKKTLQEYRKYRNAIEISGKANSSISLSELTARQSRLENLYNHYMLDTFATDKNLLYIAGNFCKSNNLTLKEYRTIGLQKNDSLQVLTRILTVEGSFIPELRLIYELETRRNAGRISSGAFITAVDQRDKSLKLDCTLYIQNIIPQ